MTWLRKAWAWIRDNAAALVIGLLAVVGAGWAWGYHKRRMRRLEDEIAVEKAQRRVEALDARRKVLAKRTEAKAEEIQAVERERKAVQRRAVAQARDVEAMDDDEVERAFRELY